MSEHPEEPEEPVEVEIVTMSINLAMRGFAITVETILEKPRLSLDISDRWYPR